MTENFHSERELDVADLDKITGGNVAITKLVHDVIEALRPYGPTDWKPTPSDQCGC